MARSRTARQAPIAGRAFHRHETRIETLPDENTARCRGCDMRPRLLTRVFISASEAGPPARDFAGLRPFFIEFLTVNTAATIAANQIQKDLARRVHLGRDAPEAILGRWQVPSNAADLDEAALQRWPRRTEVRFRV